jgi:predicted AAA+ superfamily ATPase
MGAVVTGLLRQFKCVLISGPRQVGKTTLVKNLVEAVPREYLSLDDLELRAQAQRDPKLFLELHKPPVCIDEVQYAPGLFPYIKMIVDKRQSAGDYILTGSQIYRLMRGVSESLAGRVAILDMQGISLAEENGLPNLPFLPDLESYRDRQPKAAVSPLAVFSRIYNGSMPDIVSSRVTDTAHFYSSYISTYLSRDIRDISPVDETKFFRFMTAAAVRTGQILNVADIARDAEISLSAANNWLTILETLGILFYLHPYSNNLLKRTIKKPKLYFYDTGLVCHLAKWNGMESMMAGAAAGALFETFVVSEIAKSYFNAGVRPYLYYYRDTDMKEIDLMIEQNGRLHPVEIKKAATVNSRIAMTFRLIEKSGLQRGTGAVVCMTDRLGAINRDTLVIPVAAI